MNSHWLRLGLYIVIGVVPVWIEFFKTSTDYSFRGLMMPSLASILTAATVTRAYIDKAATPNQ